MPSDTDDDRALVWAPRGRDGSLAVTILLGAGVAAERVPDLDTLCAAIGDGAGCVLLTEETLSVAATRRLADVLSRQPAWSDLPVLVFADSNPMRRSAFADSPLGNVTFLERPVQIRTLLSTVHAALRGRQRQYSARNAIARRDEFLAMLGHELRNPLAAIVLASERLEADADDAHARERGIISRQARHLSRLVDDLLDVSRVTSGKVVLRREVVELATLAARCVEQLTASATTKAQRLAFRSDPGPIYVDGDPARIEQIISNLITNAVKYTPERGNIDVTLVRDGDAVELAVRDDGIGIDPDLTGAIFDLFTQAPAAIDRSQGGLGLGLTLVRSLVEKHGGTVRAHSEGIGRGATFTMRLPTREAPVSTVPADAPVPTTRPLRIVVIDDNEDVAEMLTVVLEGAGHHVSAAWDGLAGLAAILEVRPDVAIVDIGLPGLDGLALARRVRSQLGEGVRLVAMTGYGQPDDRERARRAGFDVHLVKPATPQDLLAALG
jgi:signal transduction histidine kinase/CheY-like chemotaxis protein